MRKYHSLLICKTCKKEMEVRNDYIKKHSGFCISCNLKGNSNAKKHGDSKTRLYKIWMGLFFRRYKVDPNVCLEWLDFYNFKDWALKNGYSDKLTIDRVNPKLGYNPDNCQWISREKNSGKDKIIWNDSEKIEKYKERKRLGITQKEFAVKCNVSRNTVQRAERYAKGVIKNARTNQDSK